MYDGVYMGECISFTIDVCFNFVSMNNFPSRNLLLQSKNDRRDYCDILDLIDALRSFFDWINLMDY